MAKRTKERHINPIITWVDNFSQAEADDKAFWWSQTPEARLRHLEQLRRLNYGLTQTTARLQRIIEFVPGLQG